MNILLLGPQGSGKGTQARLLAEKFSLFYFESGEFLREIALKNNKVREVLDKGELVDERELTSYIMAYLDEKQIYNNIIFDGFPRTIEQYEFFKKWLGERQVKFDVAFLLVIGEESIVKRLSSRRMDPESGKIYNLITDLPPADVDINKLIQREDDKPEAIKKRIQIYKEMTLPLVDELRKDTKLVEIDGEKSINEIQAKLEEVIRSEKN